MSRKSASGSGEFDWDRWITVRLEEGRVMALEREIAHVISLEDGELRCSGLAAVRRAAKEVCLTPIGLHLLAKYESIPQSLASPLGVS